MKDVMREVGMFSVYFIAAIPLLAAILALMSPQFKNVISTFIAYITCSN